jgi:hypothetical protein
VIQTIHRVFMVRNCKEKLVLETADIKEANKKDAQLDIAMAFMFEAERMIKDKETPLPDGMKLDQVEGFLEEVFIKMSEDPEGLKRAIKGQPFKVEGSLPAPEAKPAKKPTKKVGV